MSLVEEAKLNVREIQRAQSGRDDILTFRRELRESIENKEEKDETEEP